jgi:hypothetical protein
VLSSVHFRKPASRRSSWCCESFNAFGDGSLISRGRTVNWAKSTIPIMMRIETGTGSLKCGFRWNREWGWGCGRVGVPILMRLGQHLVTWKEYHEYTLLIQEVTENIKWEQEEADEVVARGWFWRDWSATGAFLNESTIYWGLWHLWPEISEDIRSLAMTCRIHNFDTSQGIHPTCRLDSFGNGSDTLAIWTNA